MINSVVMKHNPNTPQRKRRARVWLTIKMFYIPPIKVNDLPYIGTLISLVYSLDPSKSLTHTPHKLHISP